MAVKNGVEEISKNGFNEKIKSGVVIVEFFAEWCMPCLMMAPVIEEMSDKFKGKLNFLKVNIDDNQGLSQKYNVMSVPTLIIFKKGKEVERLTGALPSEQLEEKLNSLLK